MAELRIEFSFQDSIWALIYGGHLWAIQTGMFSMLNCISFTFECLYIAKTKVEIKTERISVLCWDISIVRFNILSPKHWRWLIHTGPSKLCACTAAHVIKYPRRIFFLSCKDSHVWDVPSASAAVTLKLTRIWVKWQIHFAPGFSQEARASPKQNWTVRVTCGATY